MAQAWFPARPFLSCRGEEETFSLYPFSSPHSWNFRVFLLFKLLLQVGKIDRKITNVKIVFKSVYCDTTSHYAPQNAQSFRYKKRNTICREESARVNRFL